MAVETITEGPAAVAEGGDTAVAACGSPPAGTGAIFLVVVFPTQPLMETQFLLPLSVARTARVAGVWLVGRGEMSVVIPISPQPVGRAVQLAQLRQLAVDRTAAVTVGQM